MLIMIIIVHFLNLYLALLLINMEDHEEREDEKVSPFDNE